MNPIFQHNKYLLKRQVFALAGKFRFYAPNGQLVLFSEQKMFKLREDIRVYADESKAQEVLMIKARQIIDFSAALDVVDSATGQKVGALRQRDSPPCCAMNGKFWTWAITSSADCSRTAWAWL